MGQWLQAPAWVHNKRAAGIDAAFWSEMGFDDVELVGISREQFERDWSGLLRWVPDESVMEPGDIYYELVRLVYDGSGNMDVVVSILDENGAPEPGLLVLQGWDDGPQLPEGCAPFGGQVPYRTNHGHGMFTNAEGQVRWTWGGGEGCDPRQRCAHWYWIAPGDPDIIPRGMRTEVIDGMGWKGDTPHHKLLPTFRKVIWGGEEPPEPPGGGEWAVVATLFEGLSCVYGAAATALQDG